MRLRNTQQDPATLNQAAPSRPFRPFLLLPLALAALALVPATSQANSSETNYHPGLPSLESTPEATQNPAPKPKGHSGPSSEAPASSKPKTGSETTEGTPEGEPESGHRDRSGVTPPGKGGNHPPGAGGKQGHGSPQKPAGSERAGAPTKQQVKAGAGVPTPETDGGGSSPVVPILIAVAVLAALSVGAVLYRERKKGNDSDLRPGQAGRQT
jgi:hypothetical protein